MPRTVEEIMAHADELARAFEDYEPDVSDERPADPVPMLIAAARGRAEAEHIVLEAVRYARKDGLSWATVGTALGTTGEAARQRYGRELAATPSMRYDFRCGARPQRARSGAMPSRSDDP